jgi:hypothetical protein
LDVSELSLEFGSKVVSLFLHVDTENEVEVVDGGVSGLSSNKLVLDEDINRLLGAVVNNSEGNPLSFHAWDKGLTASIPSHVTVLVVEHGTGDSGALVASVSNGKEGEGGGGGVGHEDGGRELGNIIAGVRVSASQVDGAARSMLDGSLLVRSIVSVGPGVVDCSDGIVSVVLMVLVSVITLNAASVAIETNEGLGALVEGRGLGFTASIDTGKSNNCEHSCC